MAVNSDPLFEMAHTRVEAQRDKMQECARLGICPFCWENLDQWHDAPILKRGGWWAITANDHPYDGSKFHYLAIYKYHIASIDELEAAAGYELFRLFSWLCQEYRIPGATIVMRTGDMTFTGATVFHLHAQIMSGASLRELTEKPVFPDSYITSALGYKMPK